MGPDDKSSYRWITREDLRKTTQKTGIHGTISPKNEADAAHWFTGVGEKMIFFYIFFD